MTEEIKRAEQHLAALDAFIASPAHAGYVVAKQAEIEDVKNRILMLPPTDPKNISLSLMAHGEWECLQEALTTFEDARVTLKKRIDDMVDRQNQDATNTKT